MRRSAKRDQSLTSCRCCEKGAIERGVHGGRLHRPGLERIRLTIKQRADAERDQQAVDRRVVGIENHVVAVNPFGIPFSESHAVHAVRAIQVEPDIEPLVHDADATNGRSLDRVLAIGRALEPGSLRARMSATG